MKFGASFQVQSVDSPAWAQTGLEQTPPPLPASMPLFAGEGTADTIVLSGSNALMQEQWCKAGSDIAVQWPVALGTFKLQSLLGQPSWNGPLVSSKVEGPRNCTFHRQVRRTRRSVPPQVLAARLQGTSDTTESADPPPGTTPSPSSSHRSRRRHHHPATRPIPNVRERATGSSLRGR